MSFRQWPLRRDGEFYTCQLPRPLLNLDAEPTQELSMSPMSRQATLALVRCLLLLAMALVTTPVQAEEDELKLSIGMDNEFAELHRPDVIYGASRGAREYLPRFNVSLDLGLTDWLDVGTGFAMSLPRDSTAQGVTYKGLSDVDVSGSYWDIWLPARVAFCYTNGSDLAWRLVLEGGLAFIRWETSGAQPNGTYNAPVSLRIPTHPIWLTEGYYRIAVSLEWRPTTHFAAQFQPYFAQVLGTNDVHIGINLQTTFLTAVGF